MRILGIESSCDETAIAIYDEHQGLVAHALYSQIKLHQNYGGVVPELASRDHIKHLGPLLIDALRQANLNLSAIDAIAYTQGPGLIGALLAGSCFAKSLSYALDIPSLGVHHLEAHVLAAQLEDKTLEFPFLALIVSGGHTEIIYAKALGEYECLGQTLDDAVGEAFDKTAKLMGLPYPGGARLAQLADTCPSHLAPLPKFPRPMLDRPGLNFSFSGLKTHALNVWSKSDQTDNSKHLIARAFQDAVVDTLVAKCERAIQQTGCTNLVVAGGVGANQFLRKQLKSVVKSHHGRVFFPSIEFCTDNGAMIAYIGFLYFSKGYQDAQLSIDVNARWPLSEKDQTHHI